MNAIFQSLFTSFFIGFRRICLHAKVRHLVFIICSLLVGIDCVNDKLKATFSWRKNLKTGTPKNTENRMLRLWNFNIFWGRAHLDPTPPLTPEKGDWWSLVDRQPHTLFKPTSYFNYCWNPWDFFSFVGPIFTENSSGRKLSCTNQTDSAKSQVLFGSKLLHIRRSLKHHDRSRPLLEHKDKHSNESWN